MVSDRIRYSISNNADTIQISNSDNRDFTKAIGRSGFGIAPTDVSIVEGAGGGGRFRNSRRKPRAIKFPIYIFGDTSQLIEDKMRRFARLLNDKFTTPILSATYPDGSVFTIPVHYSSGADPSWGSDTNGKTYARWDLVLEAPDPYWTAQNAVQFSLRSANAGRGLLGGAGAAPGTKSLAQLKVSSSQTIGKFTVVNDGDVEAQPIWSVTGPGDSFVATRDQDGASFAYNTVIPALSTITFDTRTKKVTDQNGVNKYIGLGTAPKLFSVPIGTSFITVSVPNTTTATLVTMYFLPRRELVFG